MSNMMLDIKRTDGSHQLYHGEKMNDYVFSCDSKMENDDQSIDTITIGYISNANDCSIIEYLVHRLRQNSKLPNTFVIEGDWKLVYVISQTLNSYGYSFKRQEMIDSRVAVMSRDKVPKSEKIEWHLRFSHLLDDEPNQTITIYNSDDIIETLAIGYQHPIDKPVVSINIIDANANNENEIIWLLKLGAAHGTLSDEIVVTSHEGFMLENIREVIKTLGYQCDEQSCKQIEMSKIKQPDRTDPFIIDACNKTLKSLLVGYSIIVTIILFAVWFGD
jgi:hypothetical protein